MCLFCLPFLSSFFICFLKGKKKKSPASFLPHGVNPTILLLWLPSVLRKASLSQFDLQHPHREPDVIAWSPGGEVVLRQRCRRVGFAELVEVGQTCRYELGFESWVWGGEGCSEPRLSAVVTKSVLCYAGVVWG